MKRSDNEKPPIIFEKDFSFNNARIFGKSIFICTLLNNMHYSVLYGLYGQKPKGKKISHFHIEDKEKWNSFFGSSTFSKPIFELQKRRKQ